MDVLSSQKGEDRRAHLVDDMEILAATRDLFIDVASRAQRKFGWVVARAMLRPLAGHPTLGELSVSVGIEGEYE